MKNVFLFFVVFSRKSNQSKINKLKLINSYLYKRALKIPTLSDFIKKKGRG